jgi:hypothetical protein
MYFLAKIHPRHLASSVHFLYGGACSPHASVDPPRRDPRLRRAGRAVQYLYLPRHRVSSKGSTRVCGRRGGGVRRARCAVDSGRRGVAQLPLVHSSSRCAHASGGVRVTRLGLLCGRRALFLIFCSLGLFARSFCCRVRVASAYLFSIATVFLLTSVCLFHPYSLFVAYMLFSRCACSLPYICIGASCPAA